MDFTVKCFFSVDGVSSCKKQGDLCNNFMVLFVLIIKIVYLYSLQLMILFAYEECTFLNLELLY